MHNCIQPHWYQVGDIIIVNKTYYEVQKILLQHTRLKDSNGAVLWYPNIKMVGEQVQNLTRSELLWQSLKVLVVRFGQRGQQHCCCCPIYMLGWHSQR